jgi:hypothetical protein
MGSDRIRAGESKRPGGTYYIEASRLLETGGAGKGKLYHWPMHMAEKTWIELRRCIVRRSTGRQIGK